MHGCAFYFIFNLGNVHKHKHKQTQKHLFLNEKETKMSGLSFFYQLTSLWVYINI